MLISRDLKALAFPSSSSCFSSIRFLMTEFYSSVSTKSILIKFFDQLHVVIIVIIVWIKVMTDNLLTSNLACLL